MPTIGDPLADRYRLDALIGSGGFAAVFRARDLRLDRDVAVKVLLANHATDPLIAARFDREARVLAAINHPNVVAIHDVAGGGPDGAEPDLRAQAQSAARPASGHLQLRARRSAGAKSCAPGRGPLSSPLAQTKLHHGAAA